MSYIEASYEVKLVLVCLYVCGCAGVRVREVEYANMWLCVFIVKVRRYYYFEVICLS